MFWGLIILVLQVQPKDKDLNCYRRIDLGRVTLDKISLEKLSVLSLRECIPDLGNL